MTVTPVTRVAKVKNAAPVASAEPNQPPAGAGGWRPALLALAVVLAGIVLAYRDTASDIVAIWLRSETFAHCLLVPPISLWLIWRLRAELCRLSPRPSAWALPPLAGAGFLWLLGALATVGVVAQFALASLLILAVPAVLGGTVARRIAFPLAFLYFAVPFGEFALPWLMEGTANATVAGLRLSGIPVYREGLNFVIPSGRWSVVEACSGVRYLIASLCVGTLFAYLTYRSFWRRAAFCATACVVPVFANWLRAYMIVIIGHYSGNTLAVGVDHLIYGWVFFGLVIGVMFWVGSRWREDEALPGEVVAAPALPVARSVVRSVWCRSAAMLLLTLAVALAWPPLLARLDNDAAPLPSTFPGLADLTVDGWTPTAVAYTDWQPDYANAALTVAGTWSSARGPLGVHLAYYRKQNDAHKMVSSGNALVAGGSDARWIVVEAGTQSLKLGDERIEARSVRLRARGATPTPDLRVWQWYWVAGRLTASDYLAKAYTAWAMLSGQGDDAAVIVVHAPIGDESGNSDNSGNAVLKDFVAAAWPQIEGALQRTREQR